MGPVKRGPTSQITTPEEKWAIIHDKSDPPKNILTEAVKILNVTDSTKNEAGARSSTPSVAVKDDKAPFESEWRDKDLHLGLLEHAKAGPWARTSLTISPVMIRHWRHLELRKWM
jgi:hypothetical protein